MMASEALQKVAFLIIDNDVHILEQGSQPSNHTVIRATSTVLTVSLVTTSETLSVLISTHDNQIWLVPTSQLVQDDSRKTDHNVDNLEEQMDSEDIFEDLLCDRAQGDKQVLDFDHLRSKSQNMLVFNLTPQHLLYSVDGTVIDVEAVDDLVSVLVDRSGIAEVHILKICAENQQHDINLEQSRIILLESFTTGLNSASFNNYFIKKMKCLYIAKPVRNNSTHTFSASKSTSKSWTGSQTSIDITIQLFTFVFGKEAACLNSPVLILCTDNGSVYSYEIRSVKSAALKKLSLVCQMDSEIVGILPIQTLDPTAVGTSEFKDIVSVLASSLKEKSAMYSRNQASIGLVIFCSTGKGCLFRPPTSENDCPPILMFSVPHLMKCCIVHGHSVIYSTGKSVEACDLKLMQEQKDGTYSVTPILRTLMGKCKILKLLPFSLVNGTDKATTISAFTCSLDWVSISTQPTQSGQDSVAEGTHSFKDMLQSIDQFSVTFKSLKKDSLCIDSYLLQLNIFANLAQKASSDTSLAAADLTKPLITCICSVVSTQNVYKQNWNLKIALQNTSSVSLSEDWVVLVILCDNKERLYHPLYDRLNLSYSFPLFRGLKFKSSIDFCLPLDKLLEVHPIPSVDIKISLALRFMDVNSVGRNVPEDCLHKSMKVEIHKQQIDILHFFHKLSDRSLGSDVSSGYSGLSSVITSDKHLLCDEINKLAQMRVTTGSIKDNSTQDKSRILNTRLGISEIECKEHQLFNTTRVLVFLLKDSNILIDDTQGAHIQLEDPHGHLVMLIVSTATGGHDNSDKSSHEGFPIVLTLKGENASLLLQTRSAIKSRLKVHNSGVLVLQVKSGEELRKQLTFLEGVQKDLHHIRSALVAHREDEDNSVKLLFEMVDKSDLLANSS